MLSFKKKQETENLEALRDITDDVIEGDFVPYACHWDPTTVITKNGELLQTIKITGFVHEGLETQDEDANLRLKIREAVMKYIDSTKYAVWIHTIRRKKSLKTEGGYKRDFSGYLNHYWNDKNDWENRFVNEVYVTIVREGKQAKISDFNIFLRCLIPRFNTRYFESYLHHSAKDLAAVTAKLLPVLNRYGARLLGVVKRGDEYYSELCEFLGKLTSLRDEEFPMRDVDLSRTLTEFDVTFGYNAMEVRMRSDGRRRFGAILTLREYRELAIDALDVVLQMPAEFIISQSFEFAPAKVALESYQEQKKLFAISKSQVLYEKTGLKEIIESDKGRKTDFGQHQINLFILADSIKVLEHSVATAAKALARLGMAPIREEVKQEECYWAQLPGNFEFIRRMRPISTNRIGGFANLSNFPAGVERDNHWGAAVTTLYTAARTPYFFNFHKFDNGHTMMLGPEGAGKTVLLNFLLSETRKFNNRLFFFDTGRSSEIFIRSLGGEYYNPCPGADARPYTQLSLNPFRLEDNTANREFLRDLLLLLSRQNEGSACLPIFESAIAAVFALSPHERSLRACIQAVAALSPDAAALLGEWENGAFAGIFHDGDDTLRFSGDICGFEMGGLALSATALPPVAFYLLHRILAVLDGRPAVIVLDQAWDMLDNPLMARRISAMLEEMTEKNALAILTSEKMEYVRASKLTRLLLDKMATQIYLPDTSADMSYMAAFGLMESEISYLSFMNVEDRHFMIKRDRETIVCELSLAGMTDIMAVLSSTPANLRVMEQAIADNGLSHAKWMPVFLERI